MKEYFEALHQVYFKSKTSLSQEPNKNFNFFSFSQCLFSQTVTSCKVSSSIQPVLIKNEKTSEISPQIIEKIIQGNKDADENCVDF